MNFYDAVNQMHVFVGCNSSRVRNNNLIAGQKSLGDFQLGFSARSHLFKNIPKLSLQGELMLNPKGYEQHLDTIYFFRFTYISIPILLNYTPIKHLSIHSGIEWSGLICTSVKRGIETYRNNDLGVVVGLSCFDKKWIGFYSRFTYGLIPMLDYYCFDKLGNFAEEVHDLKNMCLSFGIKIKLYDDKLYP